MHILRLIFLYLKHQKSYVLLLIGLFALPLGLFLQFSTYQLPKIQYVFLGVLIASQYFFYDEKNYRRKVKESVTKVLKRELKRTPSLNEIHSRSDKVVFFRGVSIAITVLCILGIMLYFQEF